MLSNRITRVVHSKSQATMVWASDTEDREASFWANYSIFTPVPGLLRCSSPQVASITLDQAVGDLGRKPATIITRPKLVPQKLDFKGCHKFEGNLYVLYY